MIYYNYFINNYFIYFILIKSFIINIFIGIFIKIINNYKSKNFLRIKMNENLFVLFIILIIIGFLIVVVIIIFFLILFLFLKCLINNCFYFF